MRSVAENSLQGRLCCMARLVQPRYAVHDLQRFCALLLVSRMGTYKFSVHCLFLLSAEKTSSTGEQLQHCQLRNLWLT